MLPEPHIYDFIQKATPISELKIYKISSQSRKRRNIIGKLPSRFVMIGDSYCRFDPLYGQGMTVAAMEAELLGRELGRLKSGETMDTVVTSYWDKLPKLTDDPWDMALVEAYRHPEIVGARPNGIGLKKWFTKKVYKASAHESSVYLRLAQVMNLTHSANAFFQPSMLWKLLRKQ
jgi:flavin-dependent dehydrogenase